MPLDFLALEECAVLTLLSLREHPIMHMSRQLTEMRFTLFPEILDDISTPDSEFLRLSGPNPVRMHAPTFVGPILDVLFGQLASYTEAVVIANRDRIRAFVGEKALEYAERLIKDLEDLKPSPVGVDSPPEPASSAATVVPRLVDALVDVQTRRSEKAKMDQATPQPPATVGDVIALKKDADASEASAKVTADAADQALRDAKTATAQANLSLKVNLGYFGSVLVPTSDPDVFELWVADAGGPFGFHSIPVSLASAAVLQIHTQP